MRKEQRQVALELVGQAAVIVEVGVWKPLAFIFCSGVPVAILFHASAFHRVNGLRHEEALGHAGALQARSSLSSALSKSTAEQPAEAGHPLLAGQVLRENVRGIYFSPDLPQLHASVSELLLKPQASRVDVA